MVINNNFRNHLNVWKFQILGSILMVLALFFLKFDHDAVMIFLIFWLIYTIPAIFLYLEYFFTNIGISMEINVDGLVYCKHGIKSRIYKNQIESITYFLTPNAFKGSSLQFLSIESFQFLKIEVKTGQIIFITNLLSQQLEKDISLLDIPVRRKKRLFCTTLI